MDGGVDLASEQCLFEFLGEKSLFQRSGGAQADIQSLVACGLNDALLDFQAGMCFSKAGCRFACLNEG